MAVRSLAYWLVVEVWFHDSQVETINALGEGLPLEDTEWPWPGNDEE
jgi:hypothetical protein